MSTSRPAPIHVQQSSPHPSAVKILRLFVLPFTLIALYSFVLFSVIYARPFTAQQDIGSAPTFLGGLHTPERNSQFTYAYTTGTSRLHLPQTGRGTFIVRLRLGAPDEQLSVAAHLGTIQQQIDLKPASIRLYHVLLPGTTFGDVDLSIHSTTTHLAQDPRSLGVLIDWLNVQSLGVLTPPLVVVVATILALCITWLTCIQIFASYRVNGIVTLVISALIFAAAIQLRGTTTLVPIWLLGPALFFLLSTVFINIGERRFTNPLLGITTIFLVWRVTLWLVSFASVWYSKNIYAIGTHITIFGERQERTNVLLRALIVSWFRWDTGFYQDIALHGYKFSGQWPTIAFFPLYPLIVRFVMLISGSGYQISSLVTSNLALVIACYLLFQAVEHNFDSRTGYHSIVFLLLFPTSFFFVTAYTESLALVLVIAAVWAIQRQRWWLAGLAGFFLALTRLPGILIAPVIVFAYLHHHQWRWNRLLQPTILASLLPPVGLAAFMAYQWWRFGTPFAFMIAQQAWENHLQPPWAMPFELWTTLASADWPMKVLQSVTWISFIVLTVAAFIRLPRYYGLAMFLFLVPPYLSSWNESLPRYVLMAFPAFIVMALYAKSLWVRSIAIPVMLFVLSWTTALFLNGFWIS